MTSRGVDQLDEIKSLVEDLAEALYRLYNEVDPLREELIKLSRDITVNVRRGFGSAYRRDLEDVRNRLIEAGRLVDKALTIIEGNLRYRDCLERVVKDSMREYSELVLLYTWLSGDKAFLMSLSRLNYQWVLEGVRDFAGEVFRFSLDGLIKGDCGAVYNAINLLEEIGIILSSRVVPNYIYSNYKRDMDSIRRAVDNLKSEYIRVCGGEK